MSATEGPIETEMNDTEQHATSEDVGTPGSSEVSKTNDMNGETSPVQHKKRHRTSRDTLLTSLTPELTGKRQRKVNPIYSEFALDKKTSHVLGQDEQGKTGTEPNSPVSPAPSTPQATTPTPSSQPLPPLQPNSAESPSVHVGKRELIASPNEVQERNKKLPKGYRYEPVVEAAPVIKKEEHLPGKRERKKSSYVSDFVSDIKDDKKKEKEEKHTKPKKMKKKTPTSTPTSTPVIPPFPATKKQHTPTPTHYGASTPTTYHYQPPFFNNNNITDVQKRKLELEAQMRFLEEQIASVNQKIELKQIELAQIEATKQPKKYIPPTPPAPVAPPPAPVVVAAPAPVPVQPTTPTPLSLPTTPTFDSMDKKGRVGRKAKRSSVYDRFDSEEDEDDEVFSVPKRKGRPPLSSGSKPGRKSRKSRFDEDSSEEEPLDADPKLKQCEALLRRLRKHGYAWPFNQPVDPIALGIPDYYTIITRPMDLGTVGKNLQAGDYGTIEEFADDVRLVFNNAATYNRPGSDIFVMAETLLKVFEEDFSKLSGLPPPPPRVHATPAPLPEDATATTVAPLSVAPPLQPSPQPVVVAPQQPPPQPLAHLSPPLVSASYKKEQKTKEVLGATIQELRDSMKYVREEIQKLRRDKGLTTPTASATPTTPAYPASTTPRQGRPGRAREEAKEMTFDEKRILSQNINNLPPENLGKVLQIIHTRMPHLAQAGSDDIEIDIDALDNATLRALDRYVKTCLTKLKKKQAAAKAAEISSQNTAKSIQDVKKKLRELQDKSHAIGGRSRRKDHDEDMEIDIDDDTPRQAYPSVLIPKDKDSSSSSDSSSESSSDSSSDSESDSSSDSEDEKPKSKPAPAAAPVPAPVSAPAVAPTPAPINPPPLIPVNPTPAVEPKEPAQSTPEVSRKAPEPEPEAPKIIQAGNVKKDIELKNLDSWTKLDTFTTTAPTTATTQDATWSQFQAKEMQKKQREKELQEQEERERRERAEREAERRKQEEQRLKEIQEQEEKRRREEEQAKEEAAKNAQRELAEKRAAERRAREAESNKAISSLDQSLAMQSFEQNSVDFSQPFSLKDDKDQQ